MPLHLLCNCNTLQDPLCIKKKKIKYQEVMDKIAFFKDYCQLAKAEHETKGVTNLDVAKGCKAQKLCQKR